MENDNTDPDLLHYRRRTGGQANGGMVLKVLLIAILLIMAIGAGEFIRVAETVIDFFEDVTVELLEDADAENRKD